MSNDSEKELNNIKAQVFNHILDSDKCSLVVVNVGTEKSPATRPDMENAERVISDLFKGIEGVKVLILPHNVQFQQLSLPAIRDIESKIVNSWNDESPIIGFDDIIV